MEGDPLLDSLCNEPRVQGDCAGIKVSRLSGKGDFGASECPVRGWQF
jgi:hypothetical protein